MAKFFFHAKRDPLICPGRDDHEFTGFREFPDGLGGETVCKHCGVGAMEHTLALPDPHDNEEARDA